MRLILLGLVVFVLIATITAVNGEHLAAQQRAFDAYEVCVEERAGMTPTAFYQQHGYYPECN